MADPNAPWGNDPIVDGNAASGPSPYQTPTADTPWASDPVVKSASDPAPAKPLTQDDINSHVLAMLNDPKVSGKQLRDYWTSLGGKLSEADSKVIDDRDTYIAKNGSTPTIGVQSDPSATAGTPGLVDNRPYSFGEGIREGVQHVISNVAGGAGWVGNKVGLDNNWGDDLRQHFHDLNAGDATQGSGAGRVTGEVIATAPAAIVAAPVEAGAGAIGLPAAAATGLGLLATGGLQGALSTNARTPGGVAKDAAIGAGLELGLGGAARGLGRLASTPTRAAQQGREVLDAADRLSRDGLNVAPLPADVGGSLTRGAHAVSEAGLVSNIPLNRASGQYLDAVEAVRDRAAQSLHPAARVRDLHDVAGDIRDGVGGLGDYEQRSAEQIGRMYDDAATLTGDTQIQTPRTLDTLNRMIAEADETPGRVQGVDALRALRDDLTPTPDRVIRPSLWDRIVNGARTQTIPGDPAQYAIDSLRRLRTSFGDNFDANQRAAREAANQLWGPLSEDIQSGLRTQGLDDAADAYRNADRAWAQRQTNLDEIVQPVLGDRSQEQLAQHLATLARNDGDTLDRALSIMRPDQAASVRAALVHNLGRAKSGVQNAVGDRFSLTGFATDWDKLSPTVKTTMLNGQAGQDLQDLARLAQGAKEAGSFSNTSKTGRVAHALQSLTKLASGGAAALTMGKSLLAEGALGSAMSSPALARGIVRAGEIRPVARSARALAKLGQYTAPTIADGTPDRP